MMNEKIKARNRMKFKFAVRYLSAFAVYVAVIVGMFFLLRAVCERVIWYPEDPNYVLLHFIKQNSVAVIVGFFVVGWGIVTCVFIKKWMSSLDEITRAAEQITLSPEQAVVLSDELKPLQDELNAARENALRTAQEAKEAEQRKNDLLVYLAHDLKTPLTSVIGYLTLLREETEISPKLQEKYTGISLRKAERLEDLINEFFDVTRFNLTSMELEFERVHLSRMIEQICSEFEPVLQEKNLTWKLDIEPEITMIGDPDKLSRVFDNLIRNACNYSYPDTEIQCSLKKENDSIVCRIKNHGKTISKEKMGRIFEQFFRVDSSRSSTTGGAGIGLAIAKEIVERHGGSIEAESAEESITFTVVFRDKS